MYQGKRIAAIVLARSQSNRLKDKMTLPFAEKETVVEAVIERIRQCRLIDDIIMATSENQADDIFVAIAERAGIKLFRGSENDVVSRMGKSIDMLDVRPDVIARVCSDNPLLMPMLVDEGFEQLIDSAVDVVTPFEFNSYPFGFSLVTMTANCLARIDTGAVDPIYREHVENYCFDNPEAFSIGYQKAPLELTWPELCLTLDYAQDYERLKMYAAAISGTAIEDQPKVIIDKLQNARIALIGIGESVLDEFTRKAATVINDIGDLAGGGYDLVISSEPFAELAEYSAPRGIVWPDMEEGGLLCRLGDEAPFVVHKAEAKPNEEPETYLIRMLPLAIRHLLAGPPRAFDVRQKSGEKMSASANAKPAETVTT